MRGAMRLCGESAASGTDNDGAYKCRFAPSDTSLSHTRRAFARSANAGDACTGASLPYAAVPEEGAPSLRILISSSSTSAQASTYDRIAHRSAHRIACTARLVDRAVIFMVPSKLGRAERSVVRTHGFTSFWCGVALVALYKFSSVQFSEGGQQRFRVSRRCNPTADTLWCEPQGVSTLVAWFALAFATY